MCGLCPACEVKAGLCKMLSRANRGEGIKANGVATILVLPIVAGDEIVGLLNLGSRSYKPYSRMSLDNVASIYMQLGLGSRPIRI